MQLPRLELIYANQDALISILGIPKGEQAKYLGGVGNQAERAQKQHALTAILEKNLAELEPQELQVSWLNHSLSEGLVVSLQQALYFSRDKKHDLIRMHGKLNTDDSVNIEATLEPSRFPFSTTNVHLSGRRNIFVIATVSRIENKKIMLRPAFIGWRRWGEASEGENHDHRERRVYPQSVDQFSAVQWDKPLSNSESRIMKNMPESDVKLRLAKILGSSFVAKDWGGERSDLMFNNLLIDGVQTSSSWLLKGKSVQRSMQIADLGKNGDQLERLTTDSSDVIVVQHNQYITAAVVNLAAAFANDMRNPRRFMILDGDSTGRILRDYNFLN